MYLKDEKGGSRREYAIKRMDKKKIIAMEQVSTIMNEKKILSVLNNL